MELERDAVVELERDAVVELERDAVVELLVELVVEALVERTSLGLLVAELSFCLPNPEGGIAGELQPLRLRQQGPQAPADLHGE